MKYLYFTLALTGLLYSTIGTAVTGTGVINVQLQQSVKMVSDCVNIKHRKMKRQEKMKKRCFKKLNKKITKWNKKIKRFQKKFNKCKNDRCRNKFQSKIANLQGLSDTLTWALKQVEPIIPIVKEKNYDVIVISWENDIKTLKIVQEIRQGTKKDAGEALYTDPAVIITNISEQNAKAFQKKLEDVGAIVELRPAN